MTGNKRDEYTEGLRGQRKGREGSLQKMTYPIAHRDQINISKKTNKKLLDADCPKKQHGEWPRTHYLAICNGTKPSRQSIPVDTNTSYRRNDRSK
mmetsp:Transcript_10783/g.22387  ORF Transcript_10783/g.22387 Transcript_10783/m.22387 type:complete len:95 (-) Transcript_10783:93-377(-)